MTQNGEWRRKYEAHIRSSKWRNMKIANTDRAGGPGITKED
jgi:hypothetical protein